MPSGDDTDVTPTAVPPRAPEHGPSMVDLLRLSRSKGFSPGDQHLYRQIALISELKPGQAVLDAPCGRGVVAEFFARSYEVEAQGADPDPDAIAYAEERARESGLASRLHFQTAPLGDLPYQDGVFDLTIGELGLASLPDPVQAVAELARVTRPLGSVVLIGLIWTGHVDDQRRDILIQHLGAPPLVLVEWKQALRDANVVDLHVEDWSDQAFPFIVRGRTLHRLARLFGLFDHIAILRRAWQRWGWRGLRGALSREREIRKLLGPQRTIGLTLIKGTKWDTAPTAPTGPAAEAAPEAAGDETDEVAEKPRDKKA